MSEYKEVTFKDVAKHYLYAGVMTVLVDADNKQKYGDAPLEDVIGDITEGTVLLPGHTIKPLLIPMTSLTDADWEEALFQDTMASIPYGEYSNWIGSAERIMYLINKKYDVFALIPKGEALPIPVETLTTSETPA